MKKIINLNNVLFTLIVLGIVTNVVNICLPTPIGVGIASITMPVAAIAGLVLFMRINDDDESSKWKYLVRGIMVSLLFGTTMGLGTTVSTINQKNHAKHGIVNRELPTRYQPGHVKHELTFSQFLFGKKERENHHLKQEIDREVSKQLDQRQEIANEVSKQLDQRMAENNHRK